MSGKFIIVERDQLLKDCGVFTGQIQIIDTRLMFHDVEKTIPFQAMDGVSSPDIEHAFLFNAVATAWRFAMQFEPHWNAAARRYFGARRWVARRDGDYWPGECRIGADARRAAINGYAAGWIPHEAIIAATERGYEQGRQSALLEMGKTS